MLTACVSGSFHRCMTKIANDVHELVDLGVRVLSPADPRVVAYTGEFLFVASDIVRSVKLVQDRHLKAIAASDFLWLVTPDGYVGQSASMEIGYAVAYGVPIFSQSIPLDLTIRQYVQQKKNLKDAVETAKGLLRRKSAVSFEISPYDSIEIAHQLLETMRGHLVPRRPEFSNYTIDKDRERLVSLLLTNTEKRKLLSSKVE